MRQHSLEAYGGLVLYLYYISSSWMIGPSSLWLHYYLVPWYEVFPSSSNFGGTSQQEPGGRAVAYPRAAPTAPWAA